MPRITQLFTASCILTVLFFTGLAAVFIHSYYLGSYRTVGNFHDPRWRVFDFNSRQATEGDIYTTAETPVLRNVRLAGQRRLRFEFFLPSPVTSWTTIAASTRTVIAQGPYPEIPFTGQESMDTYVLRPEGSALRDDIVIRIGFWPEENYRKANNSWPDNYWIERISAPVGLKRPHPVDAWAGLPDDDRDIIEARRILGYTVDMDATTIEKIERVYRFMMEHTNFAHEIPSDTVQAASPLETYRLMNSGAGRGFCENHALVYYLFANAAGVKTRLVDLGGKLGPLKLTGHFFCESWVPEHSTWAYVDPETYIAYVTDAEGVPQTTLALKRLVDLDVFEGYSARVYDSDSGVYVSKHGHEIRNHLDRYWIFTMFEGDVVLGYTFGYGNNRSFSKIRNFLREETLLYAPFALPRLYLVKYFFLYGFLGSLITTGLMGVRMCIVKRSLNR